MNVIPFAERRFMKKDKDLTPEQRLKLFFLIEKFGEEEMSKLMIATDYDVDRVFSIAAITLQDMIEGAF